MVKPIIEPPSNDFIAICPNKDIINEINPNKLILKNS